MMEWYRADDIASVFDFAQGKTIAIERWENGGSKLLWLPPDLPKHYDDNDAWGMQEDFVPFTDGTAVATRRAYCETSEGYSETTPDVREATAEWWIYK